MNSAISVAPTMDDDRLAFALLEIIGYEWADNDAPRFQLNPMGYRGYIEGRPVRQINR